MKSPSIRSRLTFWYAGSLTVLIALFAMLIDGLMHERLLARTDFELDEELHELALEVEIAANEDDMRQQLDLRFGSHKTFEFVVQTLSGSTVFSSPGIRDVGEALPLTRAEGGMECRSVRLNGLGDCRVGSQPARGPDGRLSIAVVMPLGQHVAELQDLRVLLVSVGPLIVLVAIAGGAWLAQRSLRPVAQMTATASRITAEHARERLEVSNPHDELGGLATTLNGMIDRLQRTIQEMRQFTADAAHELRTPLTVIRSTAEIALRYERPAAHYEESLQAIAAEAERLTQLSDQLLMLAREDAGLTEDAGELLDLGDLLQDAVTDIEPLADQKELRITCDCRARTTVLGNPLRLRRVFLNLLENAVKYTPPQGSISVELDGRDGLAEVAVRDTGIGIAPEHLPHVFDRFYRADPSHDRDTGGTGLGLAICRAIVERHQGSVSIRSALGRGTVVRVLLPSPFSAQSRAADAFSHANGTGTP